MEIREMAKFFSIGAIAGGVDAAFRGGSIVKNASFVGLVTAVSKIAQEVLMKAVLKITSQHLSPQNIRRVIGATALTSEVVALAGLYALRLLSPVAFGCLAALKLGVMTLHVIKYLSPPKVSA